MMKMFYVLMWVSVIQMYICVIVIKLHTYAFFYI